MSPRPVSDATLQARHQQTYDDATSELWQAAVYEPVHQGWRFANIGGRRALDFVAAAARRDGARRIAELCSGTGDTCRYLAERVDGTITGLEINATQIAVARAARSSPARAALRYRRADVTRWRARRPYDLIFALDSLMLVGDLRAALARAHAALAPGRRLIIYDVIAGERIDRATLRYAWERDGIVNLPSRAAYGQLLRSVGFIRVGIDDRTAEAAQCFATIARAVRAQRGRMIAAGGAAAYAEWSQLSARYRDAFAERKLAYCRIVAARQPPTGGVT